MSKGVSDDKNKHSKTQMTRRNNDALKVGVLHRRNNLRRSPQTSLEGVSKSSSDTKKNRDFQYLKDEGRRLTILVLLSQGTNL